MVDLRIGEAVHYWPESSEAGPYPKGQPLHGWIAHVNDDRTVSLGVLSMEGEIVGLKSVPFIEAACHRPRHADKGYLLAYCEYPAVVEEKPGEPEKKSRMFGWLE